MAVDENTRLMIQLASLMMQNTTKSVQLCPGTDVSTPIVPVASVLATTKGQVEIAPKQTSTATSGDQQLMVQFAKQLLMNPSGGIQVSVKRSPVVKPATIAQLMKIQDNKTVQSLGNIKSGDGRLESQNGPRQNGPTPVPVNTNKPIQPGTGLYTNGTTDTKPAGGGPVRQRRPNRVRSGIDNYGRLENIATPMVIMHAMELMRQKDKKKRGPKEKETFCVFMYCLPDKNAKLPKFSSLDPIERALVDRHQQEGYGYPAQDYINGIPRKTHMCLVFSPEKFGAFMLEIYPALEGRLYDMYRIDKTRRLIRIEATCPRHLKDMKYQGSLIVIPYDDVNDRPAEVIHRNFDDGFNATLDHPLTIMDKITMPMSSLPEIKSEDEVTMETKPRVSQFAVDQPMFPDYHVSMTLPTSQPIGTESEQRTHDTELEVATETYTNGIGDSDADVDGNVFENVKILSRVTEARLKLKRTKRVHIKPESIFTDMVDAYRQDTSLEGHRLSICFQVHQFPNGLGIQHDEDVEAGSVIVMFWEEAFRKHFTGNQDQIAILDPAAEEDTYTVLGRILFHGLVLDNYLPVKISPACMNFMLTGGCSDRLLLTSLYRLMSESEKETLEMAMDEVRLGVSVFTPRTEDTLKVILGKYGCRMMPAPCDLDSSMTRIAKTYLIHNIYWIHIQMKQGILGNSGEIFADVSEDDIVRLYQVLTPTVPLVLERAIYVFAAETIGESEKLVKSYWEQYLFSLSKPALSRLLYQWCGYDCLCSPALYVKFSGDRDFQLPLFSPRQAMICLPSACTSVEELRYNVEDQLPPIDVTDT